MEHRSVTRMRFHVLLYVLLTSFSVMMEPASIGFIGAPSVVIVRFLIYKYGYKK